MSTNINGFLSDAEHALDKAQEMLDGGNVGEAISAMLAAEAAILIATRLAIGLAAIPAAGA